MDNLSILTTEPKSGPILKKSSTVHCFLDESNHKFLLGIMSHSEKISKTSTRTE